MRKTVWNVNEQDVVAVINEARESERDIAIIDLFNNTAANILKVVQYVKDMGFDVTRDADSVIVYL